MTRFNKSSSARRQNARCRESAHNSATPNFTAHGRKKAIERAFVTTTIKYALPYSSMSFSAGGTNFWNTEFKDLGNYLWLAISRFTGLLLNWQFSQAVKERNQFSRNATFLRLFCRFEFCQGNCII